MGFGVYLSIKIIDSIISNISYDVDSLPVENLEIRVAHDDVRKYL